MLMAELITMRIWLMLVMMLRLSAERIGCQPVVPMNTSYRLMAALGVWQMMKTITMAKRRAAIVESLGCDVVGITRALRALEVVVESSKLRGCSIGPGGRGEFPSMENPLNNT